jgi:hypothetical protein
MKAPNHETAWAKKLEQEQIARFKAEREARVREHERLETEAKRRQLKEQHWLRCPKCGHEMEEKDLVSIKVDICTVCEGIFFDRGELEELLLTQESRGRTSFFKRLLGLGK